ncbi:MAG: ribbon-helix-helix protein, CopG family [Deltaproteobacteria bacterium]|nr:ribbon-helix-helix protein, CopG family [Deltaproteobacteria bacterium]
MSHTARARITLSLPSDLVRRLDARSALEGVTRSGLVERLLTAKERSAAQRELEANVVAYYAAEPSEDDEALSAGLNRAARSIRVDEAPRKKRTGKRA